MTRFWVVRIDAHGQPVDKRIRAVASDRLYRATYGAMAYGSTVGDGITQTGIVKDRMQNDYALGGSYNLIDDKALLELFGRDAYDKACLEASMFEDQAELAAQELRLAVIALQEKGLSCPEAILPEDAPTELRAETAKMLDSDSSYQRLQAVGLINERYPGYALAWFGPLKEDAFLILEHIALHDCLTIGERVRALLRNHQATPEHVDLAIRGWRAAYRRCRAALAVLGLVFPPERYKLVTDRTDRAFQAYDIRRIQNPDP